MGELSKPESKNRPFPWKCPACLKREVFPAILSYRAEIKHDGSLHSVHIPALEIPQCRAWEHLLFNDRADEQINAALRDQLRLLSPDQTPERDPALSEAALVLSKGFFPSGSPQAALFNKTPPATKCPKNCIRFR